MAPAESRSVMVRRSARVPLYEYMRKGGAAPVHRDGVSEQSVGPAISSGHAVRLPVGLLLTGAACVLMLLVGAYVIGSWRGRAAAESIYREHLLRYGLAGEEERTRDPLAAAPFPGDAAHPPLGTPERGARVPGGDPSAGLPHREGDSRSRASSGPRGQQDESGRTASNRPSEDSGADPIVPGLFYLVIMETNQEGAQRLVRFCAEHGLDAHAVRRHNAPTYLVVMLPGFESTAEPGYRRLRDREVPRIGRIWRTLDPGRADFSDAYPLVIRR